MDKSWSWLSLGGQKEFIIEGIGSSIGLLKDHDQGIESGSVLKGFTQNGQNIYNYNAYFKCFFDVGIKEMPESVSLKINPNPSTGKFHVHIQEESHSYDLEIYNYSGGLVLKKNVTATGEIDLSGQSKGIYFLKIGSGENYQGTKIIMIQ